MDVREGGMTCETISACYWALIQPLLCSSIACSLPHRRLPRLKSILPKSLPPHNLYEPSESARCDISLRGCAAASSAVAAAAVAVKSKWRPLAGGGWWADSRNHSRLSRYLSNYTTLTELSSLARIIRKWYLDKSTWKRLVWCVFEPGDKYSSLLGWRGVGGVCCTCLSRVKHPTTQLHLYSAVRILGRDPRSHCWSNIVLHAPCLADVARSR